MTDKEFQKTLNALSRAHSEYHRLLEIAKGELEERYGYHPSNVDCDSWIDTFHVSPGPPTTVKEVDGWMRHAIEIHKRL